jgi:hypothetical protein
MFRYTWEEEVKILIKILNPFRKKRIFFGANHRDLSGTGFPLCVAIDEISPKVGTTRGIFTANEITGLQIK